MAVNNKVFLASIAFVAVLGATPRTALAAFVPSATTPTSRRIASAAVSSSTLSSFSSLSSPTVRRRLSPCDSNEVAFSLATASAFSSSTLNLAGIFQKVDPDVAKGAFWFQFLAGSGGLGIGIAQLPRLYGEWADVRSLRDASPTEGGPTIDLGVASGLLYPRPAASDLSKVFRTAPTAQRITAKSTSNNYFAQSGYVVEEDFIKELTALKCNPLAIKCAFDALTGGKGSAVNPAEYESRLGRWRDEKGGTTDGGGGDSFGAFRSDLQGASVTRLSSYATLLFIVGLIGDLIVETGINAYLD